MMAYSRSAPSGEGPIAKALLAAMVVLLVARTLAGSDLALALLLAVLFARVHLIPTLVAAHREHCHTHTIFSVNLFFGWTIADWLVLLAWACSGQRLREDP